MEELQFFHPAVRKWFADTFSEPTPAQAKGWPAIAAGQNVLILAPTGSGKTLAAFLQCLNWLYQQLEAGSDINNGVSVLYVSPLKALNNDIYRNLEVPLKGIKETAARMGTPLPEIRAAVRTGDTPPSERRQMLRRPPHILITTPESLFLLLSSGQRRVLSTVRFVIVDEIHALFPNKRGTQLSLSLEYLEEIAGQPVQRIGLSATMRPLAKAAEFLGGGTLVDGVWVPRPVTVIDSGTKRQLDLRVELPVDDLKSIPENTIWPSVYRYLLRHVEVHSSTLIFVNNRRLAERVATELNSLCGREIARVHHGSLARKTREEVEGLLKTGKLKCLVATSSLELGIDVGCIDLVIQVESPHEVSRGLQRVGRAGHVVGRPSTGRIVVKGRADLLEAAVITREMTRGEVEPAQLPTNCLDVLAQQIVGMAAGGGMDVKRLYGIVRRAAAYRELPKEAYQQVLAMLSGQFGADEFVDLRPRVFWDQVNGVVTASETGKRLVYTSGGTIPDRGYYGVYRVGSNVRIGELEEEFVYERRIGDRFVLGTNIWRVEEIRSDRVIVSEAQGSPTVPFWKGEGFGWSYQLGCCFGRFLAKAQAKIGAAAKRDRDFLSWLEADCGLDPVGASNLGQYLEEQYQALGILPTDQCLVIEEFPDELGEWRVVVHSVFGKRVNRPMALLLADSLRSKLGIKVVSIETDNGIMFVCPAGPEPPDIDPRSLTGLDLSSELARLAGRTPLFGALFRENAARALILPRQGYGRKRTPLWLSRLKAADLLQIVDKFPDFSIVAETYREVLSQAFDLSGLREVVAGVETGKIRVERYRHRTPSPFAQSLLFETMAGFMYSPDQPRGERHLQLLGIDPSTLRRILGEAELRQLLDADAIQDTVRQVQRASGSFLPQSPDELHAWLLRWGEWMVDSSGELEAVGELVANNPKIQKFLVELHRQGRVVRARWGTDENRHEAVIARELLPSYATILPYLEVVDMNGSELPQRDLAVRDRLSSEESVQSSNPLHRIDDVQLAGTLEELLHRFARLRGPFTAAEAASRYGLSIAQVTSALHSLKKQGLVEAGEFLPGGTGQEWCEVKMLQRIHRRSLARARESIKPKRPEDFAMFLLWWQGVGGAASGDPLVHCLDQLAGLYLPGLLWESSVLPARVKGYEPSQLDQLFTSGLYIWKGKGGVDNLHIAIEPVDFGQSSGVAEVDSSDTEGFVADILSKGRLAEYSSAVLSVFNCLRESGALSIPQLWQRTEVSVADLLVILEELAANGIVTNDSFGPVRYFLKGNPFRSGVHRPVVVSPAVLRRMGRWSLLGNVTQGEEAADMAEVAAHGNSWQEEFGVSVAQAEVNCQRLLDRYGIVSREVFAAEGLDWSMHASILQRWEITGKVRRGFFVEGMSGQQYATTQAIDSLRGMHEQKVPELIALSMGDPANAWKSFLPWPGQRKPQHLAVVVLWRGRPVIVAEGKKLGLVEAVESPELNLKEALKVMVDVLPSAWGHLRKIEMTQWNGEPILDTVVSDILQDLGFQRDYRSLVLWRQV